jgi:hypothetical protein
MENILRPIYQERASHPDTLAVIMIEKINQTSPQTNNLDIVLLVIVKQAKQPVFIKHYESGGRKAALYTATDKKVEEWILLGTNRRIFDWLLNGKALFDRNEYLANLVDRLHTFPFSERKLKIGIEFGKLIRRYIEGKAFFEAKQYLDAYNHIVHALHHLSRLEIIERGFHPEVTVWKQVKQMKPEVYKLYQELIESNESLEKRLELLFLASDFLIHSRTEIGSSHILKVISQKESWQFNELQTHCELKHYEVDLSVLLEYLVEREYVEINLVETKGQGIFHRTYKVSKNVLTHDC